MNIEKAFQLWIDITGISPNKTEVTLRDMNIQSANKVLERSLKYDLSYVTTLMLMNTYLKDFTKERKLSLNEILENYSIFNTLLSKLEEFKSLLNSDEVTTIKEEFKRRLLESLSHYGIDQRVYKSMIGDEDSLAELRYSAYNAINELEIVQFTQGTATSKKPRIYKDIFVFKDINTLLKWMMTVDSGIVVAMIQNMQDLGDSYFVFAVRNGGTLSILTDREKQRHPLRSQLSRTRSKGRAFYERIVEYHFPYSILDIEFGDNHRAYISSENRLVTQYEGTSIKPIKDLDDDEIVWLIMMFDLIKKKFFEEDYKSSELSYTPLMIKETDFLLEEAQKNEIAVSSYTHLNLPKITGQTMQTENLKNVFEFEPTGSNDWMIERYDVPEHTFDVVDNKDSVPLLSNEDNRTEGLSLSLKKMNASTFGSKQELEKERLYLARYNQAQVISEKLTQEYYERKAEVKQWFAQAIKGNLPNLLKSMIYRKFIVNKDKEEARTLNGDWEKPESNGNILNVSLLSENSYNGQYCNIYGYGTDLYRDDFKCVVSNKTASIVGHFHPRTAGHIADLCGCEVHELHELLQGFKKGKSYFGNPILNSVDPMDWAIKNPWNELRMDVRIYVSKREYNNLCKQYNTGNERFWLDDNQNVQYD
ncbi:MULTISPECIES: hypothetical protein [Bacillus]|uniref:hypothetical protein n=1 Tax=Bacillus TaxID=1386 RepID=UPI000387421F|nr:MULTISPECIES: hypothetical protein [Bacillus]MBU8885927.1 hypothetical protein [Bacillus sp. FJAT-27001]CDG30075.1 protein of unknown function [Bacillus velezensis UCMB5033]